MDPTVDGGNPAPPGMYETLEIMGKTIYQLVQDFSHQQYGDVTYQTGFVTLNNQPKV